MQERIRPHFQGIESHSVLPSCKRLVAVVDEINPSRPALQHVSVQCCGTSSPSFSAVHCRSNLTELIVAIAIRRADLEGDRELLIHAVAAYINPKADAVRFDWMYQQNPAGKARAWIATEQGSREFVGMASAFPRRARVGGCTVSVWVLGDFCVMDKYRSLGPALQLQRAIIDECVEQRIGFYYDFPSMSMMAIYQRLKVIGTTRMIRLARPLRLDRQVQHFIRWRVLARWVSHVGTFLLNLTLPRVQTVAGVTVGMHGGPFGHEFTELAETVGERHGGCLERNADYLNWRYSDQTGSRYVTMTARRGTRLTAYVVFHRTSDDAEIVDLFGAEDFLVFQYLLATLLRDLRRQGIMTVSVPIIVSHPWIEVFRNVGFKDREESPMVIAWSRGAPDGVVSQTEALQLVMAGDRDC